VELECEGIKVSFVKKNSGLRCPVRRWSRERESVDPKGEGEESMVN
jgi:hypothetical protein